MNWYSIDEIDNIDTPFLALYKDRIQKNIALAIQMVGNADLLRPHVKTNKIAEVCSMMMDQGIHKFKCATIAEAEMLGSIGARDVLIAYQPVGPKAVRLLALVKKYKDTRYSCAVDDFNAASWLSEVFAREDIVLPVYIDLNTGMNRTGITPSKAYDLFERLQSLPGIRVAGVHLYDGHLSDAKLKERQLLSDEGFDAALKLIKSMEQALQRPLNMVAGGSPTFPTHIKRNVECSPGTFVFWDYGYGSKLNDQPFEYAALVVARVISITTETSITIDLGYKSVSSENPLPRVYFLNAPEAIPAAQSEEHLVLSVPDSSVYHVGDVLFGVPHHICPTVALHDTATVIDNNRKVADWKVVARKRAISL